MSCGGRSASYSLGMFWGCSRHGLRSLLFLWNSGWSGRRTPALPSTRGDEEDERRGQPPGRRTWIGCRRWRCRERPPTGWRIRCWERGFHWHKADRFGQIFQTKYDKIWHLLFRPTSNGTCNNTELRWNSSIGIMFSILNNSPIDLFQNTFYFSFTVS